MSYLLKYECLKKKTVEETIEKIKKAKGLPLKKMKVQDLVFDRCTDEYCGQGVYFFRETQTDGTHKLIYVGDCRSQSFVERIPSHFDIRAGAWMNRFLKVQLEDKKEEVIDQNLKQLLLDCLKRCTLVLIRFDGDERFVINKMERVFKETTEVLNNKTQKDYGQESLKKICRNTLKKALEHWDICDDSRRDFFKALKEALDAKYSISTNYVTSVKNIHTDLKGITRTRKHEKNIGLHIPILGYDSFYFEVQDYRRAFFGFFEKPVNSPHFKKDGVWHLHELPFHDAKGKVRGFYDHRLNFLFVGDQLPKTVERVVNTIAEKLESIA